MTARLSPLLALARRPWLVHLIGLGALLACLALGLLWSYRAAPIFRLDLGLRDDADPYINRFHEPEQATGSDLTYRWSRASSTITVPGFGRRDAMLTVRLAGAGPRPAPPPVAVLAGGQPIATWPTTAAVQEFSVVVPASLMHGGDVVIELQAQTFQAPGDARDLGVLVDSVTLAPIDGSRPALPPWRLALLAALAVVAVGLVGGATLPRPVLSLLPSAALTVALVALSRADRYTLALWLREGAPEIAVVSLCALAGVALTLWQIRRGRVGSGQGSEVPLGTRHSALGTSLSTQSLTTSSSGLLWLILWAVALATLLGVAHPQFKSSDLVMHVHRLEDVANGQWLLQMPLPGESALEAPYPPALFAVLLPFLPFVGDDFGLKQSLMTMTAAGFLTLLAAIAFVVGARVGGVAAGLWAALLHGFAPVGFLLVSQGNFSNIFGQLAAGLVLLLLAVLPDWRIPAAGLAIIAALLLGFFGHFGVFLSLGLTVPILALTVWPRPLDRPDQTMALLRLYALALFLAFLIYYRHYLGLIAANAQQILSTGGGQDLGWSASMLDELDRTLRWLGWLGAPAGVVGAVGLWKTATRAGRLTVGWLAASAVFAAAALALGLSVRYHFFALLGIAVAGGWLLARLGRLGWPGHALAIALAIFWVWDGLAFWYTRILTYLH